MKALLALWFGICPVNPEALPDLQNYAINSTKLAMALQSYEYRADEIENWKSPEVMVAEKYGDCEDFALLVNNILSNNNYTTLLFIVYNNKYSTAHMICYYKNKTEEGYFSNYKNIKIKNFKIKDYLRDTIYNNYKVLNIKDFKYGHQTSKAKWRTALQRRNHD